MVPNLLWFLIIMNANLHFKNCVYIFFPEEEAEIREEKHISSDGKCNNPKYSLHFCIRKMLLILLSVLLSGTVFAERKVEQRNLLIASESTRLIIREETAFKDTATALIGVAENSISFERKTVFEIIDRALENYENHKHFMNQFPIRLFFEKLI